MPQAEPLQPAPESDQLKIVLGLDPATGVRVAAMVAEPPEARLEGAAICSVKLLVMVTAAVACFAGSAMLCAVMVTFAGLGRMGGAV